MVGQVDGEAQRRPGDGGEPEDGGEAVAPAVAVGAPVLAFVGDHEIGGSALEVRLPAVLHGEGAAAEGFEEVAALRVRNQTQLGHQLIRSQRRHTEVRLMLEFAVRTVVIGAPNNVSNFTSASG